MGSLWNLGSGKMPEAGKWLKICTTPSLYQGKECILNLALASFVKSPLEATAESLGSVINRHAKGRCSITMENLSDEVFISWNGAPFPSDMTEKLIRKAIAKYFQSHVSGPRFYVRSKLRLLSPTIAKYLQRPARIMFN